MTKSTEILKAIPLANTKAGKIVVTHVSEPYGPKSHPVVSIGITLKGDEENPDWKTHIPYENLTEVIALLREAQERFGK